MVGGGRAGVAREVGIAQSTLRYWESVGVLPPFHSVGTRSYLGRLRAVAAARAAGVSMQRVRARLPAWVLTVEEGDGQSNQGFLVAGD